jgi:hypothetical protein
MNLPVVQVNAIYGAFMSVCSLVDATTGLAAAAQAVLMARYNCHQQFANLSQGSGGEGVQQPLLEPDQGSSGSSGSRDNWCRKSPQGDRTAAPTASKEHLSWWLAYLLCTAQFQQLGAAVRAMKMACCSWSGERGAAVEPGGRMKHWESSA